MAGEIYDESYFEFGLESGKSCYSHYKWLPELTLSMAFSIIEHLQLNKDHLICDYGCSKGFLVKALRLLNRKAYGCDISNYAVNSADNETRKYLKISTEDNIVPFISEFDYIISKDVFEHIPENCINKVLTELAKSGKNLFAVIPLGKNDKFTIPAYSLDITHVLAKDKDWWINKFELNGWKLKEFSYYVEGIKESWKNFEEGNGFFLLEKQ